MPSNNSIDTRPTPPLQAVAWVHGWPGPVCLVLVVLVVVFALLSLFIGSQPVRPDVVADALWHFDPGEQDHVIVVQMRLPRSAVAIVAGLALGAAGAVVQTMTRNPLAEPGLLGINSGAAAAVVSGLVFLRADDPARMILLAIAGAMAAGVVVLLIGGAFFSNADPVRLVLAGAAVSTILGALTSALVMGHPEVFTAFRGWDAGGVSPRPWPLVLLGGTALVIGSILAVASARSLDALALGKEMGRALGASVRRAWLGGGLSIVVLCGAATALAGPIVFLGLAATIAARRLVGGGLARLLPTAALFSVVVLQVSDLVGRVVLRPAELQAGIVCALLGAPFFVALARRSRVTMA